MSSTLREPIPISALEHYEYCPRQSALILVDGVWLENRHTVVGQRFHRRVDTAGHQRRRGVTTARAVKVWSDRYGLIGRIDAVEIDGDSVVPIEYKAGTRHGRTTAVQVCAQALCLEEMLRLKIDEGAVWYGRHRRREILRLDDALRNHTIGLIEQVHAMRTETYLPQAPADERCEHCQLSSHCLPDRCSDLAPSALDYVTAIFDKET